MSLGQGPGPALHFTWKETWGPAYAKGAMPGVGRVNFTYAGTSMLSIRRELVSVELPTPRCAYRPSMLTLSGSPPNSERARPPANPVRVLRLPGRTPRFETFPKEAPALMVMPLCAATAAKGAAPSMRARPGM